MSLENEWAEILRETKKNKEKGLSNERKQKKNIKYIEKKLKETNTRKTTCNKRKEKKLIPNKNERKKNWEYPKSNQSSWCQLLVIEFIPTMILCVCLLSLDKN